jgi:hypothetical protein
MCGYTVRPPRAVYLVKHLFNERSTKFSIRQIKFNECKTKLFRAQRTNRLQLAE